MKFVSLRKVAMATMLSMTLATVAMPAVAEAATSASISVRSTPTNLTTKSIVSNGSGYCALLTSGRVDCWGSGLHGELGNGHFYTSGNQASAIPVAVVSTSGSGTLSGVASLTGNGDGYGGGYCALLTSGGVDCWGYGNDGQLGNGQFYTSWPFLGSAIPVAVVSTSGSGTLSGVASLTSNGNDIGYGAGYCALLTSGRVDCWGYGFSGELGNGKFYTSGNLGSAKPGAVVSTSGSGTLSGVASLTGNRNGYGYCALLTSGGVDCWGYGLYGQLGNGKFDTSGNYGSAKPVAVVSTSGSGTLSGVASLTSNGDDYSIGAGYCALLTSGRVDCWGSGRHGELGNGKFYKSGDYGSAKPVAVVSTSGSGTLSGVASLTGNRNGYCALLTSGRVDCWGYGFYGQLGNGPFYTSGNQGSAIPVAVVSTSGSGTLSGVASLTGNQNGYCALLTSGRVDCWGFGYDGELGNGQFYTSGNQGSAIPVAVVSTSGSGTLSGVASLTGNGDGNTNGAGYCALLTSGRVDCWGIFYDGELGNGQFYTSGNQGSAKPVAVVSTSGSGNLSGVKLH